VRKIHQTNIYTRTCLPRYICIHKLDVFTYIFIGTHIHTYALKFLHINASIFIYVNCIYISRHAHNAYTYLSVRVRQFRDPAIRRGGPTLVDTVKLSEVLLYTSYKANIHTADTHTHTHARTYICARWRERERQIETERLVHPDRCTYTQSTHTYTYVYPNASYITPNTVIA